MERTEVVDWPQFAAWTRSRVVLLVGLALIAVQLVWKAAFLSHFYFWQDDFHFFEQALRNPFGWNYLTFSETGHFTPGTYAVAWLAAHESLYNWGLASAITMILVAAADLAALLVLRTLFGERPAILVLLVLYLATPLTMPDTRWWVAAVETIPLQIATFMALDAQVRYVRTGRFRHALATAGWLLFGLVFFEKALILPLLLLGVTSAFLVEGPWLTAIGRSLVRYWRAWCLQLVVLGGYLAVFITSIHASSVQSSTPGTAGGVYTFIAEILKDTFLPGALGGPWQWLSSSGAEYAYAAPPATLAWLSVIVAVLVVATSIVSRRYAWRAWAILAGWLAGADIAPILLGRISELGAPVLGLETRYVADAVPVLAICLGLAFLPVAGGMTVTSRWAVAAPGQAARPAAAAVVGAIVVGSVWSVQAFQNVTSSQPDRIYISNARSAIAEAPTGTVVADEPVPSSLMLGIFGPSARAASVIRPMETAREARHIHWTSGQPDGTIDHLMVFGPDGRMHTATVFGRASMPIQTTAQCQAQVNGQAVVRFTAPTGRNTQVLQLAYLAGATAGGGEVTVTYRGTARQFTLKPGLHDAYVPVQGSAGSVTVSGPGLASMCLGTVQAGVVVPSSSGPVIPSAF